MHGRFIAIAASVVTACALLPGLGAAQTYPARPVKIIVPAQPGGGLDLIGRTIGEQLGRSMGQTFIIENVSGGGGAIAVAGDGPRRAGRLHADGGLRGHARHQSRHAQGPVRRGQGLHRDRNRRRHAQRAGGPPLGARQQPEGARRLCAEERREGERRDGRDRHAEPPHAGAVQDRRRARSGGRALPRHRPGDHRPGRGADADADAGPGCGAPAYPRQEDEADRRDRSQAASAAARRADVRGIGVPGLRRGAMVRNRRSGEAAAGDHGATQCGDPEGARLAGAAAAPGGRSDPADADDARAVRQRSSSPRSRAGARSRASARSRSTSSARAAGDGDKKGRRSALLRFAAGGYSSPPSAPSACFASFSRMRAPLPERSRR